MFIAFDEFNTLVKTDFDRCIALQIPINFYRFCFNLHLVNSFS